MVRLGNYKNRPRGFNAVYMPGGQIALFIPNKQHISGSIENIRFFVSTKGNYKRPYGVHLYSVDSITGKPGKELSDKPILISNTGTSGWQVIGLKEYHLDFPDKGVFAAMEWLPDENFSELVRSECQFLCYNRIKNENNTWYCALGINWYQLPDINFNAMISIDVLRHAIK